MELTSDYPFWSIQNGLPRSYPSLRQNVRCDAVVVGGGISGALAAYFLADAGVKTVLIDKRDIGTGSTSGSTALLQYEVDVPLRELIDRIGEQKAFRSYELCHAAVKEIGDLATRLRIDCDFAPRPSLFLARHLKEVSEFQMEYRLRKALGFELQLMGEKEISRRFPFSRPCALFSENGGQVDPHRLTHGLLHAACARGLQVYDRTEAVHFEPRRNGIRLTTEGGQVIHARRAIIAAGFESMKCLKGTEAGHLKSTYALISEPMPHWRGWHRRCLIWESGSPYLYLRTTSDHRIIVGGEDVALTNPRKRDQLIPKKTAVLAKKFSHLFPGVKLEVAYSWAGTFGETKDGLAYIGETKTLPHAYFMLGYGGNGITYSLIAAKIIRDAFLARRNPDAEIFRFGR